jgi:hypothetical protein
VIVTVIVAVIVTVIVTVIVVVVAVVAEQARMLVLALAEPKMMLIYSWVKKMTVLMQMSVEVGVPEQGRAKAQIVSALVSVARVVG